VEGEAATWAAERNAAAETINWRSTTADARIKLKRLSTPQFTRDGPLEQRA
jgi:hypothetical protein